MEKFKKVLLIAGILVAGFAISVSAQKRADKTSSAKAYYGSTNPNYKLKKNKKYKYSHKKSHKNKMRAEAIREMVVPKRWF